MKFKLDPLDTGAFFLVLGFCLFFLQSAFPFFNKLFFRPKFGVCGKFFLHSPPESPLVLSAGLGPLHPPICAILHPNGRDRCCDATQNRKEEKHLDFSPLPVPPCSWTCPQTGRRVNLRDVVPLMSYGEEQGMALKANNQRPTQLYRVYFTSWT